MTRNMGTLDRGARLVAVLVLLFVAFGTAFGAQGIVHWAAILVAAVFALTAIMGNCPLYSLVGLKTCKAC